MERTEDELIDALFVRLREQIPKTTIKRVLDAYAWLRIGDAFEKRPK